LKTTLPWKKDFKLAGGIASTRGRQRRQESL